MSPRDQLLKMQRIILRQLKESVLQLQGQNAPDIDRYYQAYKREFKNYQKISNKSELLRAAKNSDIIFGADFHPFPQSQRTHLRILRELVKGRRPVVMALEAIDSHSQHHVDDYLKGKWSDQEFLKKINYFQKWGFPWENYKVLFELATAYKIPVFGINRSGYDKGKSDLQKRDVHSAERIVNLRRQFPDAIIYVIYGDLHLASPHLPRLTRKMLGKKDDSRFLTVFQDSESLYWRLARKNLEEEVDVLKLRGDAFCVVNSPPWIKWQFYLHFLEHSIDRGTNEGAPDYGDQITHYVKIIQQILKIDKNFTDFHAYAKGDVQFAQHVAQNLTKKDFLKVMGMVRQGRSFFVPSPPIFYIHSFGINQMVSLVGQYIHAKMRGERHLHLNFPADFIPAVWIEAVGFFVSKLINNRRKEITLAPMDEAGSEATLMALEQKLREEMAIKTSKPLRLLRRHKTRKSNHYQQAAKAIGYGLGNRIYSAYQKGKIDQATLHSWLRRPVEADASFNRFYVRVLGELKNLKNVVNRNERL